MSSNGAFWNAIEQVDATVSFGDGPSLFQSQFAAVPRRAAHLFAAHWCYTEVCNGGFTQFYGNSTGILAPEAVAAFCEIGMPQAAAVIAKANSWFGFFYPRYRPVRQLALKLYAVAPLRKSSPFEKLDLEFFRLCDTENGGFEVAAKTYFSGSNAA
jgi:hypothetical protein